MSDKAALAQNLIDNSQYMLASLAFGLGAWLFKVRQNRLKATFFSFFSEITFALLAGFITFWICENFNLSQNMNWILISINSWSGSKFLSVLEYIVAKMTAQKFDIDYTPVLEEIKDEKKEVIIPKE